MMRIGIGLLGLAGLTVAGLTVAGCGGNDAPEQAAATETRNTYLLATEPGDAVSVTAAKAAAQEGDALVMRARIGGRKAPISEESGVFTVMDLEIPHCGQMKGDACPTPWDYCCETPESMKAHSATVQLIGADGTPIARSPADDGLEPLDEVVLVGTVGPRPTEDVLIVRATGVYRVGS
jgi:hypothetical protein